MIHYRTKLNNDNESITTITISYTSTQPQNIINYIGNVIEAINTPLHGCQLIEADGDTMTFRVLNRLQLIDTIQIYPTMPLSDLLRHVDTIAPEIFDAYY